VTFKLHEAWLDATGRVELVKMGAVDIHFEDFADSVVITSEDNCPSVRR
jgi:hypothetical protein